jgi:hypothetical protein
MRLGYFFATAAIAMLSSTAMAGPHNGSCHGSVRTHGGAYAPHFHDDDCDVIYEEDEDDYDDCHREVLRHSISGYGKVWHRHRGSSCRVEIYEDDDGPTPGIGGCVQIGPSVICGYGN